MDAVSLARRSALAIVVLTLMTCTPVHHDRGSDCPSGVGSSDRNHPLICIDDSTEALSANPYSIEVNDRQGTPGNISTYPVVVRWATRSGRGDLGLTFKQKGCFEPDSVKCFGNGRCVAKTKKIEDGKTPVKCEYDLNLNGRVYDPEV
ncbi:MAG TPA: hypothetical protein VF057_02095, partial [Thermoanaerobaculia bacterium]